MFYDVINLDHHLSWERLIDECGANYPFSCLLCSLVTQALVASRSQKGFPLGWGTLVIDLIMWPWRMAWGLAILVDMYHELHEVVYHGGHSWAYKVVLCKYGHESALLSFDHGFSHESIASPTSLDI